MKKTSFGSKLTLWYREHQRDLPWRNTHDPYLIWLSEIILQQTQVKQGLPYFLKFKNTLPTIQDFYAASEAQILKLWEGLGYYRRALNAIKCIQYITTHCQGKFPSTYTELIKIPGIGDYTASAIASFAFNKPEIVIDGNVKRVITRHALIASPIHLTTTYKAIRTALTERFTPKAHYDFNQGIMELGALICTPKNPHCSLCPVSTDCQARVQNLIADLPVKAPKSSKKNRYFHFFLDQREDSIRLIQRQDPSDIWYQMYSLPHFSTFDPKEHHRFLKQQNKQPLYTNTHLLSHQKLYIYLWQNTPKKYHRDTSLFAYNKVHEMSFPKPIRSILSHCSIL